MIRVNYQRRRIFLIFSLRIPDIMYNELNDLKKRWKYRVFHREMEGLRKQGYRYALPVLSGGICYRLHKLGCSNLIQKRSKVKPIYLHTLEEYEELRGKAFKDKEYLECQACFKS